MAIDKYLDKIDDLLEEAWNLPFTGGKRMIDIEKVRELMDAIRMNLPQEMKEAKAIVSDRSEILSDARAEANSIVKRAEEKARQLVSREEVLRAAQQKAQEIMNDAREKSKATERAAMELLEGILKKSEDVLVASYTEVKNTRAAIHVKTKNK